MGADSLESPGSRTSLRSNLPILFGMEPEAADRSKASQPQLEDGDDVTVAGETRAPLVPPGWLFHGLLLLLFVVIFWASSSPTGGFEGLFAGFWIVCLAIVWLVRFIWMLMRDWRQIVDLSRWYIAPAMVVLAIALLILDVPLKTRFAASRSEFEAVVATAPPTADYEPFDIPLAIGSYEFTSVYRIWDAIIFHSESFHHGGFAYLPHGTTGIGGPIREVRSLGGDWYYWSHSW